MSSVSIIFRDNYISKKTGKSKVVLRLFISGVKHEITIKDVAVNKKYWDYKRNRIKASQPDSEDLNLIINMDFTRANEILRKYRLSKIKLSWELFHAEWKNPTESNNFILWIYREINERYLQGVIKETTRKKHLWLVTKLKEFRKDVYFSEIDQLFLNEFKKYMVRIGNRKNTQGKDLINLKVYISIAVRRKLIQTNPYIGFIIPKESTEPFFLTELERNLLLDLYNKKLLEDKYQKTLRAFLFICYTGLRPSDFKKLKMEQITEIDGMQILNVKMHKTSDPVHIPLSKQALKFIKDEAPNRVKNIIFKTNSTQKMNDYLKYICRRAIIEPERAKQVSLKVGRHTFATLSLLKSKSGAGILQVSKLLGHRTLKSTEVYLHVLNSDLNRLVNKI